MTTCRMRRLFSSSTRANLQLASATSTCLAAPRLLGLKQYQRTITDVRARQASVSRTWFTASATSLQAEKGGDGPPNERNVKLGKTVRILHERLPTLLVSPLPQDILSPQISLHLFPSSHPHLPTVSGKIAYTAALWTAPMAWGRVPVVGNVKLKILSERMVKNGCAATPADMRNEKLIVKWETCKSEKEHGPVSEAVEKISSIIKRPHKTDEKFSGLFIFEFDEEGRVAKHTIEHMEENGQWDKTAKVISVTDWLLGRAWGRREEAQPSLAYVKSSKHAQRHHDDYQR
ncbi:hypothetical protein BU23DRAFT_497094 [Bimuria novae-zelandiae CBS 107.79]|uniref:Uncharacterized protein n=1 Tax=Bimuria novae-zelandiae CBS 107.79 TaxID=1447943 RepID=A0A6A5VQR6_9PLEO|nr:hypothetical protein BU23DRAFT_497094 [Bimuria novae-zelandiae CBS 107.79]